MPPEFQTDKFTWSEVSGPGFRAIRRYWPPIALIQATSIAVVLAYYRSESVQGAFAALAGIKAKNDLLFAIVAGFLAGSAVPEIAKLLTGKNSAHSAKEWWGSTLFNGFAYALIAVEVNLFYNFQAFLFGQEITWCTLLKKNLFDMFVFSPTISILSATLLFDWKANRFRGSGLNQGFGKFYRHSVLPSLVLAWFFWIPVLFCTYALPKNIQFIFSNFAEAAWSILFIFISTTPGLGQPERIETVVPH